MSGDPTMAGCKDPERRMRKLNERRQHLEDTIAQMQDQHFIIEHEIAELQADILKDPGFVHTDTIIVSRECPR